MKIEGDWSQVYNWLDNTQNRKQARTLALFAIGDELKKEVKDEARKVYTTGTLFNSIVPSISRNQMTLYSARYGRQALETGTKPGTKPNMTALKRWARLKLGDENLAYPIAKKIEAQGTLKYQRGRPKQLSEVEKRVNSVVEPAVVKLLEAYVE